ncbi:hypothetical protein D9619_003516 [Psilocybe cf. subviscida]|uniref:Uncharacterized protein n=1 Tax=Psilocybe cf. subviscida TaxID=2480587 RepID=A0A8H5AXQ0_9AGAR|nr:hypothetical protein D9619_003516 [Psilocybe cf. subviscida]
MAKFCDTLAATYGTLPMLRNVIVGNNTASSLIDILSIGSDEQGDWDMTDESDQSSCSDGSEEIEDSDDELDLSPIRSSSPIAFPALRNLKLRRVTFDRDEQNSVFVVELDHIEKCLINRSRRGVGILVLVLEDCQNLFGDDVGRLGDLVPDVGWYRTDGDDESEEGSE